MKRLLAATILGTAALSFAPAASAQEEAGDKVNQLIIYGDDVCPQSTDGSITVCARKDESERYRIPQVLRESPQAVKNEAWTQRVKVYETVGATGTKSCSPVGAGGMTGCMEQLIGKAYAEKAAGDDVQMGRLIEAEREKRLSTIDQEAAEEQARVESLEKQYEEKRKREEAGEMSPTPPPVATSAPQAQR
jgi:hypothetical protein